MLSFSSFRLLCVTPDPSRNRQVDRETKTKEFGQKHRVVQRTRVASCLFWEEALAGGESNASSGCCYCGFLSVLVLLGDLCRVVLGLGGWLSPRLFPSNRDVEREEIYGTHMAGPSSERGVLPPEDGGNKKEFSCPPPARLTATAFVERETELWKEEEEEKAQGAALPAGVCSA